MKVTTTLNKIRDYSPCEDGWEKLLKSLGKTKADDETLTFEQIYSSNGYDDTLWCLRSVPEQEMLWRHFAVDAAEMVEHLMDDERSKNSLRVARRHAEGQATDEELTAARAAARDAAWDAAWAAAWAAARAAAWDAARDAAWDAAWAAARAAAWDAARDAAWAAARAAAWDAAWDAQMLLLMEYCRTGQRVDWRKFLGGNPLQKSEVAA